MSYEDILHLPYPRPSDRPRMSQADRAAQFSPFAALTGYEESIRETGRLTDRPVELMDCAQAELDEKLRRIHEQIHRRPPVQITCFRQDPLKPGGRYVTMEGKLKTIDPVYQLLELEDGAIIWMENLLDIRLLTDTLED